MIGISHTYLDDSHPVSLDFREKVANFICIPFIKEKIIYRAHVKREKVRGNERGR